ncbi:MAG: glutathione S-transferase family protein [Myxococcota bacterium]
MTETTLYYSPGAISLPVHMVLRELALPFALRAVPTGSEAHLAEAYLATNPVGRVPALASEGRVLTETQAILRHLSARAGGALLPADPWERARVDELLARALTMAQPAYRLVMRPDRFVGPEASEAVLEAVRASARREFRVSLGHLERGVDLEGWAVGEGITLADPVLATLTSWARFARIELTAWPRLRRIGRSFFARPSAREALRAEGLVDAEGRPTPPARV